MDRHGPSCPNPFCACSNCECGAPCVCGLQMVAHSTETRWDAGDLALLHMVTTVYQPDIAKLGPEQTHQPAAHPTELTSESTDDPATALSVDPAALQAQMVAYGARTHHADHESHVSVREAVHKGHTIEIQTTYRVLIDGRELGGHFGVDEEGSTHYHGLPNYQQASAVDLVRTIIDQFPDDFPVDDPEED